MFHSPEYLFTSERLGFRNWKPEDIDAMAAINADPEVMEFFLALRSHEETATFIAKMQTQFVEKGFCYFAVDTLENKEFIGFTGLSIPDFEADFTPCVDIGWRLKRSVWGKGFATEGAGRCLDYGFTQLGLTHVYAIAPCVNVRSEHVMKKTGMQKVKQFLHPLLEGDERLQECVLYEKIKQ
jgi:RimJ/RimL family protein N-acetyltransferase